MIMKKKIWTMLLAAMVAMQAGAVDITDPKLIWDGKIADKIYAYKDTKTIYIYTPGEFIALHDQWSISGTMTTTRATKAGPST